MFFRAKIDSSNLADRRKPTGPLQNERLFIYRRESEEGESNGTLPSPLQYSCLENPMDGGSW